MATKRPQEAPQKPADAKNARIPSLRHSPTPGVFLNSLNIPCDENGVALDFVRVKQLDRDNMSAVLDRPIATPRDFLESVAMDPRQPLGVRMEAAKIVIPYTDRRKPQSIDGGVDPQTGEVLPLGFDVSLLSDKELSALDALLAKGAVGE